MKAMIFLGFVLFSLPAWADEATSLDLDGDGFSLDEADCDDTRAWIHPDAKEACDGLDSDCNGVVPDSGTDSELDEDGDGWRVCAGDCDDGNPDVHPFAAEACDGIDSDCDGVSARTERDLDGDGFSPCRGDCDDGDPQRVPDPGDVCDGQDEDCDGVIDENCDGPGDDDDSTDSGGCHSRGCGWSFRPAAALHRDESPLLAFAALGLWIGRRRRIV